MLAVLCCAWRSCKRVRERATRRRKPRDAFTRNEAIGQRQGEAQTRLYTRLFPVGRVKVRRKHTGAIEAVAVTARVETRCRARGKESEVSSGAR